MKNLQDAYETIKKIIPNAIDISKQSAQGGVYIAFDSLEQTSYQVDLVSFKILIQAKSLNDDNRSILPLIEKIRENFIKYDSRLLDNGVFSVKFINFTNALYSYEIAVSFKIFRDIV